MPKGNWVSEQPSMSFERERTLGACGGKEVSASDEDQPIVAWMGSSRKDIREFPEEVRREAGFELRQVQRGEQPSDFKYMGSVGTGVYEIRLRGEHGDHYRVMYIAKYEEGIYVLHAFQKTSRETEQKDIDLARSRLQDVESLRRERQETQ